MKLQETGSKSHKEWWFAAFPTSKATISKSSITFFDAFRTFLPGTGLGPFSQDLNFTISQSLLPVLPLTIKPLISGSLFARCPSD